MLGALLILAVIAVCLPLTVPRLMGYQVYAIISGSMEPAIPTGSLVYAKQAEPETVQPDDVVVFNGGFGSQSVITHRVVTNDAERREFITKGDANEGEDVNPVPYGQLLGRVEKSVPVLGYFLPAISNMGGKLSLLGVLAAAVLLQVLGRALRREA